MAGESERVRGVLLGLLTGDRNGGPIQMALELAWSLRPLGRFSPEDVRSRYLNWFLRRGTDTGPVSARVFELISLWVEPADAVAQVHCELKGLTAGCNPAHRAAPLAMCSFMRMTNCPRWPFRRPSSRTSTNWLRTFLPRSSCFAGRSYGTRHGTKPWNSLQ